MKLPFRSRPVEDDALPDDIVDYERIEDGDYRIRQHSSVLDTSDEGDLDGFDPDDYKPKKPGRGRSGRRFGRSLRGRPRKSKKWADDYQDIAPDDDDDSDLATEVKRRRAALFDDDLDHDFDDGLDADDPDARDLDTDDLDTNDLDDGDPEVRSDVGREGESGVVVGTADTAEADVESETDDDTQRARVRGRLAGDAERFRSAATSTEQRSAWMYLMVVTGLFVFLAVVGYACNDERNAEVATGQPTDEVISEARPSSLVFVIDGDTVTVQGTVPDEAARAQLIALAENTYGAGNVTDGLTVDESYSLDGASVRYEGSAATGDGRPEALQAAVGSDFALLDTGFEVALAEAGVTPVDAEVALVGEQVVLSGALPDDQSIADLVAAVGDVWGPENVDAASLIVGSTTWTEGTVRVTGNAPAGDERLTQFAALVPERLGTLVSVDTSAVVLGPSDTDVDAAEAAIAELVTANPIQFSPNSAEIAAGSDEVLVDVAAQLNELPDSAIEVVGHTDNVGPDDENLVLSEQRAEAVVSRLVELGVEAGRLTARGAGETEPVGDNSTDEGKAANRRIEFILGPPS